MENQMTDYPYTLKPSTIEDFLKNMPQRPEPKKVSQEYMKGLGYTSSNDWALIPIFKFINFLDSDGVPTDLFKNFRDTRKSGAVMAQALKDSYKGLFELHANPCGVSDPDLENFFRTATGRGGRTLEATVATFKVLCKFADFQPPPVAITPTPVPSPAPIQLPISREGGITVNVSIRLELPATQDAGIYDKIFQSLKKNLLTSSSKED
jgi:hypothetical protein